MTEKKEKTIKTVSGVVEEAGWIKMGKNPFFAATIEGIEVRTFDPEVVEPEGMPPLKKGVLVERLEYHEIVKDKTTTDRKTKKKTTEQVIYRNILPPIILEGGVKLEKAVKPEAEPGQTAPAATVVSQQQPSLITSNAEAALRAIRYPRDEIMAVEGALGELEAYPEFAEKAYYSIPYKNERGSITMIEGPSIKAAMTMLRHWGNADCGGRVVAGSEDENQVLCEGVFIDLEKNIRIHREIVVRKIEWRKKGKFVRINEDRLKAMIQKGISLAARNATINGLPLPFVERFTKKAKQLVAQVKGKKAPDVHKQIDRIVGLIVAKHKIEEGKIVAYIKTMEAEFETPEDTLAHMMGLWNSISDGQLNPRVFFLGEAEESPEQRDLPLSNAEAEKKEETDG